MTPNEVEAGLLTGIKVEDEEGASEAAKVLLQKGVDTVLVTLGLRGALVARAGFQKMGSSCKVQAIDTTGAGDVFNGALAVALSEGKELTDAVRFANAAAALSVTKLGAQPSIPRREEIAAFMSRQSW